MAFLITTLLVLTVLGYIAYHTYHAAVFCWRLASAMAVAIATSPIVAVVSTLASRAFFAVLTTIALLIKLLWIGFCRVLSFVLTATAVRYMVTTVSSGTHQILTSMASLAVSIPIFDAHGHVTAWRVLHLRVGFQLLVTDHATPHHQQHHATRIVPTTAKRDPIIGGGGGGGGYGGYGGCGGFGGRGSDGGGGKLYLGDILWETTKVSSRSHFGKYGALTDAALMKDKFTGQPRGFGFVTFADASGTRWVFTKDRWM